MRRVGKGFSRVETPLFEGMLVAGVIEEEGDAEEQVQDVVEDASAQGADTVVIGDAVQDQSIPSPTPPTLPPQQPQDLPSTSQKINTSNDTVMEDASNQGRMIDDLYSDASVALMDDKEEEKKVEEAKVAGDDQVQGRQAEIYQIDMDHASKVLITAASTAISAVKPQVPAATTTAVLVRVSAASTRRRKGVVIRDSEEELTTIIHADTKSKDKGKGIMVEEPKPLKKSNRLRWMKNLQGSSMKKSTRTLIGMWPLSIQEEEVKDLKRHLEIVPDEDDDVYTEATLLARKVPVVDYEIIHLNNKPYYIIIQADGTHQLNEMDKLKSGRIKGLPKEMPTLEVYFRSNVKCSEAESGRT
uniref:Uncharacterized protein n=1 Tax=Tanacetum cinerariifolium TaxID=118510 RepID=A0A6L2L0C1_TANCI|nr:hypothetical protein [Tanacetum cinerariifolium]